jgi:hypothetical protein
MADRAIATDPVEPLIVVASSEMPATPDGMIQAPARLFEVEPPDLDRLRKMYCESRDLGQEERRLQKRDRDYYDGPKQLQSEVRATLKMRGQPAIYTNRIRPAIDGILGVLEGAKVDPRAYPRNPDDEDASGVATKTLRFVADKNRYQQTKLDCAEDFLIEGVTAVMIEGTADDVPVSQIRQDEFFYDKRSRRPDFKDARFMGFAKWLYADTMRQIYPEAYRRMGDPVEGAMSVGVGWEDKPEAASSNQWVDRRLRRILVITLFYEEQGQWYRCVYCAAGVFDHGVTGYTDDAGFNICPIEAQSCYVDNENNRYGRVRDMIPIQDEINARRSRLLHLANSRQIQQTDPSAPPVNNAEARREAAKADGVIPAGWQIVQTADIASGQANLLAESKSEIERMGPTPAVLGRQGDAAQSGRARLVLQNAGLTELARPLGRFDDLDNRCYRAMWRRAQQFWTDPMWIRVTDDLKAPDFVKVNEPVTVRQASDAALKGDQKAAEALSGILGPELVQAAIQGDPQARSLYAQFVLQNGQQPIMVKNRLADLDMDIIVDSVPDQANLEAETFAEFVDLVKGGLDPFSPQFELLLEMSTIADKAKVLERLRAKREEIQQAQAQAAAQQAEQAAKQQQIAEAGAMADIQKTGAETAKTVAQTEQVQAETMGTALTHLRGVVEPEEGLAES